MARGSQTISGIEKAANKEVETVVIGGKAPALLKASLNAPQGANSPQSPGLAQFERCVAENKKQSAPPKSWTTKPILILSHPFTMPESLHKQLVNALTGLPLALLLCCHWLCTLFTTVSLLLLSSHACDRSARRSKELLHFKQSN